MPRCTLLMKVLLLLGAMGLGAAPGDCQEPIFVATWQSLAPNPTRPGRTVAVVVRVFWDYEIPESATLDLTSLGLSSALPMARSNSMDFEASFTVPAGTPPGDFPIYATARGVTSSSRALATLRVTLGVLIESVALSPKRVQPGESATLTAVVTPGNGAVASVTADLSHLGLPASVPMERAATDTWQAMIRVPAGTPEGYYPITVQVRDALGRMEDRSETLQVTTPQPVHFTFSFGPNPTRAGRTVTARIFSEDAFLLGGASLDLSALGLSSALPFTSGSPTTPAASFVVPAGTAPGDYTITLSVHNGVEIVKVRETLTITIGPILEASFQRSHVPPGGTATLIATVDEGVSPTETVTADLSVFGLSAAEPLPAAGETGKYTLAFAVPLTMPEQEYDVAVTATDVEGRSHSVKASVTVARNVPLVVQNVTVEPSSARAGESATLVMTVEPYTGAQEVVKADLSALGIAGGPLVVQSPSRRTLTFTIPAETKPGDYVLAAEVWVDDCFAKRYTTTLTVLPPLVRGDVDASGAFTMADVATALRIAAGISSAARSQVAAADVADENGPDGRITLADAIALARALVGGQL